MPTWFCTLRYLDLDEWSHHRGLAETSILWPCDANCFIWKDPDPGKVWRQENGTTEDEMVGWHHWLNGHEFEKASGVGGGQGSLVCCSPWARKEPDMTERLNWTELYWVYVAVHRFSLVVVYRLLIAVTSLVAEHSVVVAHGLHCLEACETFPDKGLNLYPLHWQADSLPLNHQGNPPT